MNILVTVIISTFSHNIVNLDKIGFLFMDEYQMTVWTQVPTIVQLYQTNHCMFWGKWVWLFFPLSCKIPSFKPANQFSSKANNWAAITLSSWPTSPSVPARVSSNARCAHATRVTKGAGGRRPNTGRLSWKKWEKKRWDAGMPNKWRGRKRNARRREKGEGRTVMYTDERRAIRKEGW